MDKNFDFIVIGAGLAGLTCAYRLQEKGHNVLVLESAATPGGRIQTVQMSECLSDTGAQFFSESYPVIGRLIQDLNLGDSVSTVSPEMNFITGTRAYSLNTSNPFSLLTSGLLPWRSYLKLCVKMLSHARFLTSNNFESASALSRYDGTSADHFLKRNLDEHAIKNLFDPFFSGFSYSTPQELSEAMVIRTLGHFFKRKKLFGLKRGLFELIAELAAKLNIKTGVRVEAIIPEGESHLVQARGEFYRGNRIVMATTAGVAKKLLIQTSIQNNGILDVRYSPSTHLGMVFRKQNNHLAPYGNMVLKEKNEFINVVTFESRKAHALCPAEFELVHVLSSREGHSFAQAGGDLRSQGLQVLESISPYKSSVLIDVRQTGWNEAIPIFSPGRGRLIEEYRKKISSREKVFLAGDYMGTPCSEGAAESGEFIASLFPEVK